jgi:type IV pilus assembly protein PilA
VLNNLKVRRDREDGFTLIELMVVVLIIAILIAIAIPTFLGARNRAQDRAAQSSLRNALTAAKTAYTDNSDYSKSTNTDLGAIEPSLTFEAEGTASGATAGTVGFKDISVAVSSTPSTTDHQIWAAAALSKSGTCMYIIDTATGSTAGTQYGTDSTANASANCTGTKALTAANQPAW